MLAPNTRLSGTLVAIGAAAALTAIGVRWLRRSGALAATNRTTTTTVAEPPAPRTPELRPEDQVEVASDDSFPASDPPGFSSTTVGGRRGAESYEG